MELNNIQNIDCLEGLKQFSDNCVDSIVTDPPAGISFMGKDWDSDKGGRDKWIKWLSEVMKEGLRVLKPGGHALVWALPRTSHWTAMALENAGFEIRDCVYHVFGSGFPKSLHIGKAVDKLLENEREIIGEKPTLHHGSENNVQKYRFAKTGNINISKGNSEWEGWGTALKPSVENWWLCRKPLSEKTIVENVLKWGVGGLNIDACRVGVEKIENGRKGRSECDSNSFGKKLMGDKGRIAQGRFPSHLIHDGSEEVLAEFAKAPTIQPCGSAKKTTHNSGMFGIGTPGRIYEGVGSPARFFYCAKASSSERNEGLEGTESRQIDEGRKEGNPGGDNPRNRGVNKKQNFHPTVKPIELMKYLIKLITPKGGTVLDFFAGSGSTLVAAKYSGFNFIGFEIDEEYFAIIKKRLSQTTLV